MLNGSPSSNKHTEVKWIVGALALLGTLLITLIIFTPYIPYSISLNEGDQSSSTVFSPRYLEFQTEDDIVKTAELKKKRESLVKGIFIIDKNINKMIQSDVANSITSIKEYKKKKLSESDAEIPGNLGFLSPSALSYVIKLDNKSLNTLEYLIFQNLESTLSYGLKAVDTDELKLNLFRKMRVLDLTQQSKDFIYQVTVHFIQPNYVFSQKETELSIQREIASIIPFKTVLKKGEPILYSNEIVTVAHIEIFKALNIYGVKANLNKFFGIFLICSIMFLLFERFVYYFNFYVHQRYRYFGATFLTVLIVIVIARVLQELDVSGFPWELIEFKYLIPIPFAAMVLSLLVSSNVSMLCGTIISILVAVMFKLDFLLFFYLFSMNCVTVFSSYKKYKRTELAASGNIVGLSSAILIIINGTLGDGQEYLWFFMNIGVGFINGVGSAMLSLAVLPYFEGLFKITTQQSLLEYSNLNHPLLKRLMLTAPGTYQHSLMVANLAETAAESLKADPVLCRVGAYFHDVGKMKRPMFFTENQGGNDNPHDGLSPRMSKIVISSHTKDGVEFAEKYKLPNVLKDIILQHHGTTLVSFFYTQALHQDEDINTETSKDEFRYAGPKPQFKESGIIMLADSVEAAVRSMKKPTLNKIENIIDKIFKSKMDDDQLSECPITLNEIQQIKKSFLNMFKGIYHSRVNYADEIDKIMEQTPEKLSDEKT
ncbi:HDIG domain-containing protein [bacterium]|jgi:cyclic-di-AMP phosphodiesterase PgpH|nr:HDIG domain-containing protein [bacterium]